MEIDPQLPSYQESQSSQWTPPQPEQLTSLPSQSHDLDVEERPGRLLKPIAIPATSHKLGSPFLRAYPSILATYGISQENFLEFLDKLNRVSVASPPVQVLGLAGSMVSLVPLHTAQIVGGSVNAAANLTTYAMSKGQTEILVRNANENMFAPHGLKLEVARLDAVAKLTGMPILNDSGKVEKKLSVLAPIVDTEDLEAEPISVQQRRIQVMEPWIQPLEVSPLPGIKPTDNLWNKLHAKASERQRGKEEKKLLKERRKAHEDYSKDSKKAQDELDKKTRELFKEEQKVLRKEKGKKLDSELRKVEKERDKVKREYEKEMRSVEKDKVKDDKEEEGIRKILWIIIRNLDDGYNGTTLD
ncbi:hypothetical protein diail_1981 [Diaporthe ilicicola]|nr:hypothetical protein diail_1981 [Diaporthe ilicicola]